MQFQVPQFIDTEDKIVGPLSLRQFGFIGAGALFSAILYFTVVPWLWIIASIFIFGAAIALAFVKIEGRPFANVIVAAFHFYWKPQTYIWKPEPTAVHPQPEKIKADAERSSLEEILAKSTSKITKWKSAVVSAPAHVESAATPKLAAKLPQKTEPSTKPQAIAHEFVRSIFSAKPAVVAVEPKPAITRENVKAGSALHKSWEDLQTGAPLDKKMSDKEYFDKKMADRYQIFQRTAGDRKAAKRVDYR